MNIDAFKESMRKKHYLYPVQKHYPWGDLYFVLIDSRNINNGQLEHIYFEVTRAPRTGSDQVNSLFL